MQAVSANRQDVTAKGVITLARVISDVDLLLQRVSSDIGLPKRAIQALLLMSMEKPSESASNKWLQEQFVANRLSSNLSASKDSSTAKSDLLARRLIGIREKVSEFSITDEGRAVASQILAMIESALNDTPFSERERGPIMHLACAPNDAETKKLPQGVGIRMVDAKAAG